MNLCTEQLGGIALGCFFPHNFNSIPVWGAPGGGDVSPLFFF